MKWFLAVFLLSAAAFAAEKPDAGDVQRAITAACGRDVVVSIAVKDDQVVRVEFVNDATAQEKTTAQTTITNFNWSVKPVSQRDADRATLKALAAKDPRTWSAAELTAFQAAVARLLSE